MRISLFVGALCLALPFILPSPDAMSRDAWIVAGLASLMVVWWLTEVVPLAVTALLPLALAPVLGVSDIGVVAASYSNPLIILFLGGFMLAKAIERWGLHQRLAHVLISVAGNAPSRILAATMVTTAFLSLWISNTAAAMVMAPIAAGIAHVNEGEKRFATALMLGVAFSATIGGMGSLIGTPPNAIFAAYASDAFGIEIGFARWAIVGLPVALVLLFFAWMVLAKLTPGVGVDNVTAELAIAPGPMSRGQRRIAFVAGLVAFAWMVRPLIGQAFPELFISDAGIAMMGAVALFVFPSGQGGRLLDWESAAKIRWDVLILFGGGLALAGLLLDTGLAGWIGQQSEALRNVPVLVLTLAIASMIVYLGELASNTAMAAIFLPIAGAAAIAAGLEPITLLLPVALASSVGFMLPVATPPNAIVFSHPSVTRTDMLRAGAFLDVIGIVIAVGLGSVLGGIFF